MRLATEADLRRLIAPVLQALHGFSVETATLPGVPDLNHVGGWLELKVFRRWPESGPALLREELKPAQRAWLRTRDKVGGRAHVLASAADGREWFLFAGPWAAFNLGLCTRQECVSGALRHWRGHLNLRELQEVLRGEE